MLIAKNLSKTYIIKDKKNFLKKSVVKEVNAVKDVSLQIQPNKIVGLLGVNGAGKTTTIKMLSAILEPTSGTITIDGVDAIKEHNKVKNSINLITGGERNVYWRLTAKENLEYFGALYGVSKKELNERIDYLLKMVGLSDVKDIPVERYSKGMKQRLQIARGLVNNPQYIFLDEPTLGLDISIAKELRNYIKKLAKLKNKGVLLTTHYIREAEELCDYIYIIDKGRIISQGTTDELKKKLKTNMETLITVDILPQNIDKELLESLKDKNVNIKIENQDKNIIRVSSTKNYTSDIVRFLSYYNISIIEMKMIEPNLEEVLLATILGRDDIEKSLTSN